MNQSTPNQDYNWGYSVFKEDSTGPIQDFNKMVDSNYEYSENAV